MSVTYDKPPIIEALCELTFAADGPPDKTLPGLLYSKVSEQFPIKREVANISVQFGMGGAKSLNSYTTQFWANDEKSLIQLDDTRLVVNQLAPYNGWKLFLPSILRNVKTLSQVSDYKLVSSVNLRYINRIDIPFDTKPIELNEYVSEIPKFSNFPDYQNMIVNVLFEYPVQKSRLLINISPAVTLKEHNVSLSIDLQVFSTNILSIEGADLEHWLQDSHLIIGSAFEKLITDKCRDLFKNKEFKKDA